LELDDCNELRSETNFFFLFPQAEKDQKDEAAHAFTLLYSMTILQVFNGDADAVSMLNELDFCYSKLWGKKKSEKEDEFDASNALVEILLSFASKPSQLFRRIGEQVFGVFAPQITADGLQSLISVSQSLLQQMTVVA
jgi:DNA polymerase phi